jgi:PAS domain S-box-containing protein
VTVLTKGDVFDLLSAHLAMFEADLGTGVVNWASRTLEVMFGYPLPGELEDESVEILIPDAVRAKHAKEHRPGYGADPRPRLMGRDMKLSGRRKDGSVFPVEVMLLPKAANKRRVVIGIVFDMTDRK